MVLTARTARIIGSAVVLTGLVGVVLAPLIGESTFERLWGVEPFAYMGALLVILGLAVVTGSYAIPSYYRRNGRQDGAEVDIQRWSEVTHQYFELFHHDLGRPFTSIVAKERDLRTRLATMDEGAKVEVEALLDEIERQTPNFRLMLSNIQVLIHLEAPNEVSDAHPVEPSEVIRRVVDRYASVAADVDKEISWWSKPAEFGIVHSDPSAIEHIATNLVDNAVRFATGRIEVRLTKNLTHFFIRVWEDGPGIAPQYLPHLFDRGWTPEVARRDEKTSSGLGLYIARSLALRWGGDITVDSVPEPDPDHHTAVTASLSLTVPS